MGYSVDQLREEALTKVKARCIAFGDRPAEKSADEAWNLLADIAMEHPDWRVGQYYWCSGEMEMRRFKAAFLAWRRSVNGE